MRSNFRTLRVSFQAVYGFEARVVASGPRLGSNSLHGHELSDREDLSRCLSGSGLCSKQMDRWCRAWRVTLICVDFRGRRRHHLFRVDHICSYGRMRDRIAALLAARDRQFLFVVNIQVRRRVCSGSPEMRWMPWRCCGCSRIV